MTADQYRLQVIGVVNLGTSEVVLNSMTISGLLEMFLHKSNSNSTYSNSISVSRKKTVISVRRISKSTHLNSTNFDS